MAGYVTATFGTWDDNVQRGFHSSWFDPGRVQIIEADGDRVGVLDISERGGAVYVGRIEIVPERQGQGIGSELLAALRDGDRDVELHVFHSNPRARALYERLGFVAVADEGHRALLRRHGRELPGSS
jgi:ribosomal protein S18 acetylase RimI-like enzyme